MKVNPDYTFLFADPNAAGLKPEYPDKGAFFYQDPVVTVYNQWLWSVNNQAWVQSSSPE